MVGGGTGPYQHRDYISSYCTGLYEYRDYMSSGPHRSYGRYETGRTASTPGSARTSTARARCGCTCRQDSKDLKGYM